MGKVPADLRADVRLIADWFESHLPQIRDAAARLPEQAENLKGKVEPAVDNISEVRAAFPHS